MTDLLYKQRRHPGAPIVVAGLTVASAAGVLAGPAATAVPGGLLLAFVLPGVAMTALVFRYRALSPIERAVLAAACSLAVMIIAGLVLYVAGFGLSRTSWTLGIAGVTLALLALKAVPERVWEGEEESSVEEDTRTQVIPAVPPRPGPFASWSAKRRMTARDLGRQLAPMVLVVALLAGAGYLSFVSSRQSYDVTVTALSATPPGPVDVNGDHTVTITASGLVAGDGPYTMLISGPDGTEVMRRQFAVPSAGGSWNETLTLPAEDRLTVDLLRADESTPYRTLYLAAVE